MRYRCAFCGVRNRTFADPSGGRRQTYTEDCRICCRPNLLTVVFDDDGEAEVEVTREYDA